MGHKLLIVDDSATTRAFIRRTIHLAGYAADAVHEAGDGRSALELLRSHPVDLVVADLHMPVMDGAEMIAHMRRDDTLRSVPILVISADPNTSRVKELMKTSAVGYVSKPFTPEILRDALKEILGGSDA